MADINQITQNHDSDALKTNDGKLRIIQETVPGKQVTLAHIIAGPEAIVYQKLGLNPAVDYSQAAIGILSMTPYEIAIIAGDLACKTAHVDIGFIDRFSGTLIFTGRISDVTSAVKAILNYLKTKLGFTICDITKT
ncbi:BMC domain-containing protein [uncultured Pseudoramibacter sp.]|jgi:ethanolamine utilization protein EutS|uniref:BMC domain-containing protein n=1 Tax=Candidatus Pseudoramibacter fermentans TaxID=2594427 RepID=A0A6L5GPS1_9FIRM|nr:BMC domain-containing protein [uncultured Pseudoramibacter sp.]MQM71956.1 BMC domain-containing protein [Candidatus Pseudoramibacter fermentans]RRF92356.1 MAG: BMC domain-containing protein [Eubacteriaceae bacterium]